MPPTIQANAVNLNAPIQGYSGGYESDRFAFEDEPFEYQTNDSFRPAFEPTEELQGMSALQRFASQTRASQSAARFSKYTVQPGDSVYKVLVSQGFTEQEIQQRDMVATVTRQSGLTNANFLCPGLTLNLPARR